MGGGGTSGGVGAVGVGGVGAPLCGEGGGGGVVGGGGGGEMIASESVHLRNHAVTVCGEPSRPGHHGRMHHSLRVEG